MMEIRASWSDRLWGHLVPSARSKSRSA